MQICKIVSIPLPQQTLNSQRIIEKISKGDVSIPLPQQTLNSLCILSIQIITVYVSIPLPQQTLNSLSILSIQIITVYVSIPLPQQKAFLFFPAKKRNRKSSPLGKDAKSQRRRVSKFLCVSESLQLCVFNFFTRFLRGGRIDGKD